MTTDEMMQRSMTTDEMLQLIHDDPEFIALKRFEHSLQNLLARFPDGVPERTIAQALMISEDDVNKFYIEIVQLLRDKMKVVL